MCKKQTNALSANKLTNMLATNALCQATIVLCSRVPAVIPSTFTASKNGSGLQKTVLFVENFGILHEMVRKLYPMSMQLLREQDISLDSLPKYSVAYKVHVNNM